MLGHAPLGVLALGQLPSVQSGAAAAPGAVLPLHLALVAGAASGEGVLPPLAIISRPLRYRYDAVARGAVLRLRLRLLPGGVVADAAARGVVLRIGAVITVGTATGDAIGYDNDFILLEAA